MVQKTVKHIILCKLFETFIISDLAPTALIQLSNQVAVTTSNRRALLIVYPLEETYRARYKSDYFPQSGIVRRPRYVADKNARHCITLQVETKNVHKI